MYPPWHESPYDAPPPEPTRRRGWLWLAGGAVTAVLVLVAVLGGTRSEIGTATAAPSTTTVPVPNLGAVAVNATSATPTTTTTTVPTTTHHVVRTTTPPTTTTPPPMTTTVQPATTTTRTTAPTTTTSPARSKYSAGQACTKAQHGQTVLATNGRKITCKVNGKGYTWEYD